MSGGLRVLATGPLATIQDLGRPGLSHLGVSPSGAADRGALALGNRLVGNPPDAAGVEITLGGLIVRAESAVVVTLTGSEAQAHLDGRAVGVDATIALPAGAILSLGLPERGLRTYLAVRGGLAVVPVLTSRSYDSLARLGPAPLQPGDLLSVGSSPFPVPDVDWAPSRPWPGPARTVTGRPGPRLDWFTDAARQLLVSTVWTVTDDLDRIGIRLAGPALDRRIGRELPSEGLVRGAIQVPPSGQPLIFLADHPTTGGYPVIAVVNDSDTDALAQLRPGQTLRLRWALGAV